MRDSRRLYYIFVLFTAISCSKEDEPKTRSFNLGFTPFPYAISKEAVNDIYQGIATEGDIINHHFDNGVPWVEAHDALPFHENIMNDWQFRKEKTPENHKVLVSVTPLNELRTGLAAYRGADDHMELPDPWSTYSFFDEPVRKAYLEYCRRGDRVFSA